MSVNGTLNFIDNFNNSIISKGCDSCEDLVYRLLVSLSRCHMNLKSTTADVKSKYAKFMLE